MNKLISYPHIKNFSLIKPKKSDQKPFIITSAHSGQKTTKYINNKINSNPKNYHSMEDMYVNDLAVCLEGSGYTILKSNVSRLVIDLNRSELEIDSSQILNIPKNSNFDLTDKVKSGIGLVPSRNAAGEEIYKEKITWKELKYRINNYYRPWHLILKKEINMLVKRFGWVVVLDIHSMPSNYNNSNLVDFVIGNDFNKSSPHSIIKILSEIINKNNFKFSFNDPYSGGYITKSHSNINRKIYCIQLEMNKSLYMDENKFIKNKNFKVFSSELRRIIEDFFNQIEFDKNKKIAAE